MRPLNREANHGSRPPPGLLGGRGVKGNIYHLFITIDLVSAGSPQKSNSGYNLS